MALSPRSIANAEASLRGYRDNLRSNSPHSWLRVLISATHQYAALAALSTPAQREANPRVAAVLRSLSTVTEEAEDKLSDYLRECVAMNRAAGHPLGFGRG